MVTEVEASIRRTCRNHLILVRTFGWPVDCSFFVNHACIRFKSYRTKTSRIFEVVIRSIGRKEGRMYAIATVVNGPIVKNRWWERHEHCHCRRKSICQALTIQKEPLISLWCRIQPWFLVYQEFLIFWRKVELAQEELKGSNPLEDP